MNATTYRNVADARKSGLVKIGEWQDGIRGGGVVMASTENRDSVQAAYDAIPENDSTASLLGDVIVAGGVFVAD